MKEFVNPDDSNYLDLYYVPKEFDEEWVGWMVIERNAKGYQRRPADWVGARKDIALKEVKRLRGDRPISIRVTNKSGTETVIGPSKKPKKTDKIDIEADVKNVVPDDMRFHVYFEPAEIPGFRVEEPMEDFMSSEEVKEMLRSYLEQSRTTGREEQYGEGLNNPLRGPLIGGLPIDVIYFTPLEEYERTQIPGETYMTGYGLWGMDGGEFREWAKNVYENEDIFIPQVTDPTVFETPIKGKTNMEDKEMAHSAKIDMTDYTALSEAFGQWEENNSSMEGFEEDIEKFEELSTFLYNSASSKDPSVGPKIDRSHLDVLTVAINDWNDYNGTGNPTSKSLDKLHNFVSDVAAKNEGGTLKSPAKPKDVREGQFDPEIWKEANEVAERVNEKLEDLFAKSQPDDADFGEWMWDEHEELSSALNHLEVVVYGDPNDPAKGYFRPDKPGTRWDTGGRDFLISNEHLKEMTDEAREALTRVNIAAKNEGGTLKSPVNPGVDEDLGREIRNVREAQALIPEHGKTAYFLAKGNLFSAPVENEFVQVEKAQEIALTHPDMDEDTKAFLISAANERAATYTVYKELDALTEGLAGLDPEVRDQASGDTDWDKFEEKYPELYRSFLSSDWVDDETYRVRQFDEESEYMVDENVPEDWRRHFGDFHFEFTDTLATLAEGKEKLAALQKRDAELRGMSELPDTDTDVDILESPRKRKLSGMTHKEWMAEGEKEGERIKKIEKRLNLGPGGRLHRGQPEAYTKSVERYEVKQPDGTIEMLTIDHNKLVHPRKNKFRRMQYGVAVVPASTSLVDSKTGKPAKPLKEYWTINQSFSGGPLAEGDALGGFFTGGMWNHFTKKSIADAKKDMKKKGFKQQTLSESGWTTIRDSGGSGTLKSPASGSRRIKTPPLPKGKAPKKSKATPMAKATRRGSVKSYKDTSTGRTFSRRGKGGMPKSKRFARV